MRKATARLELAAALVARYPHAPFSQAPEMLINDDIFADVLLDVVCHEAAIGREPQDELANAGLSGPAELLFAKLLAVAVHAELDQLLHPESQCPSVP